jgi:heme/copper-type cytochrome/quinol oxidase subunit 2
VRRQLPFAIAVIALVGILALALMFMVSAWTRTNAHISVHGWIALTLGVLFSLIIGCGLMALVFYSSRRGYDERAAQSHREVHEEVP